MLKVKVHSVIPVSAMITEAKLRVTGDQKVCEWMPEAVADLPG